MSTFGTFRRARSENYNIYSIPVRLAEILDVARHYTGRDDLRGWSVLDAACGFGGMALFLATEGRADAVVALDINAESLSALSAVVREETISTLSVGRGSLQSLPLKDGAIDMSLLYDCLVYRAIDVPVALAEHHRVLRDGGVLLIKVANAWGPMTFPFSVPIAKRIFRPLMTRLAGSADRLLLSDEMELVSALRMKSMVAAAGFFDVRVYDRYRRADRGWYRYFFPDLIISGIKA